MGNLHCYTADFAVAMYAVMVAFLSCLTEGVPDDRGRHSPQVRGGIPVPRLPGPRDGAHAAGAAGKRMREQLQYSNYLSRFAGKL